MNLFVFDVPRLSVDIDLNYVGAEGREDVLAERLKIDKAAQAVFLREGFAVRRVSDEHAGCKWSLRFESAIGAQSNLEGDINFMFRIPLWQTRSMDSRAIEAWQIRDIEVMDIHELAAGKLAALLSRKQARDLFDVHQLLQLKELDRDRLRVAFAVYGAMNRKDWRYVSVENLDFNAEELEHYLGPLLHVGTLREQEGPGQFGRKLIDECRQALSAILPFTNPITSDPKVWPCGFFASTRNFFRINYRLGEGAEALSRHYGGLYGDFRKFFPELLAFSEIRVNLGVRP